MTKDEFYIGKGTLVQIAGDYANVGVVTRRGDGWADVAWLNIATGKRLTKRHRDLTVFIPNQLEGITLT